jgi:hypothetical protein
MVFRTIPVSSDLTKILHRARPAFLVHPSMLT